MIFQFVIGQFLGLLDNDSSHHPVQHPAPANGGNNNNNFDPKLFGLFLAIAAMVIIGSLCCCCCMLFTYKLAKMVFRALGFRAPTGLSAHSPNSGCGGGPADVPLQKL